MRKTKATLTSAMLGLVLAVIGLSALQGCVIVRHKPAPVQPNKR